MIGETGSGEKPGSSLPKLFRGSLILYERVFRIVFVGFKGRFLPHPARGQKKPGSSCETPAKTEPIVHTLKN